MDTIGLRNTALIYLFIFFVIEHSHKSHLLQIKATHL